MALPKLRCTRREILKNAALAGFAAPAIGEDGTTPRPGTAARLPLSSWSTAPGTGAGAGEGNDRLTAQGHRVFAPTLTGVCERSHLDSPR